MPVFSATPPVRLPASRYLLAPSKPSAKSFIIRTCKTVSKQSTLTSFRINTYKKHRGYPPSLRDLTRILPRSSRRIPPHHPQALLAVALTPARKKSAELIRLFEVARFLVAGFLVTGRW